MADKFHEKEQLVSDYNYSQYQFFKDSNLFPAPGWKK